MYKYLIIIILVLLKIDNAYASNMGAMNNVFNIILISALLGIESFIILVLFLLKMFKNAIIRKMINIVTIILFAFGVFNLGSLAGVDMFYLLLLLLGCGALAIILPNIKIKNFDT